MSDKIILASVTLTQKEMADALHIEADLTPYPDGATIDKIVNPATRTITFMVIAPPGYVKPEPDVAD